MTRKHAANILLLTLILFMAGTPEVMCQRFSVASFKMLPNDVSAFIDPVRDLNDEDCGLIKVMASGDFAFSTPLGIVKRVDKTGEIWLYVPRGSKKMTIKHADWGVLRDYVFPVRIDSHLTYEMRINEPAQRVEMTASKPVVTTIRDTLVLTRVDTLIVQPVKKHLPLQTDMLLTLSFGGRSKELMGGVLLLALKRHGGFLHLASDFGKIGQTTGECEKNGMIGGAMPFYSGTTRHSAFVINAGASHRLTDRLILYEGLGYGSTALAWQLALSEGGGYVRNSHYSIRGISMETGLLLSFNRVTVAASVSTIKGSEWFGSIGVGIRLGK